MALTDPYVLDVQDRYVDARRVHRITAYRPADGLDAGRALQLTEGTLTIDEDRVPRFGLDGTIGLEDQELLDYLDPRAGTRLLVELGYQYPDRTLDLHPVCDLGLHQRIARRPQSDVTLQALSDEKRVMEHTLAAPLTYPAGTPIRTVLDQVLTAHGGDPTLITARRAATPLAEPLLVEPGREWDTVQDLVDQIDAVAYHDGLALFVVADQVVEVGAAAAHVRTGPGGTLTATEVGLAREEFANFVMVVYRWRDAAGAEHVARGHAQVVDGPYGTATIGRVGRVVEIERPGTAQGAQATAATLLPRTISRGRRVHVEAAASAYWLRPEDTVTMRFPLGSEERALVTQIAHDLPAGTMSLHTRQPETLTIATGA